MKSYRKNNSFYSLAEWLVFENWLNKGNVGAMTKKASTQKSEEKDKISNNDKMMERLLF